MIILDTDHMSVLKYKESERYERLMSRMVRSPDQAFVTTVVTMEEQMRGWLSEVHKLRDIHRQVRAYQELNNLVSFFGRWKRLDFDKAAADQFLEFRSSGIRVATMDLKIASIAITKGCLLLTSNTQDFGSIPHLEIEDWVNP